MNVSTSLLPTILITRKVHFNAAHRLHNPAMSDAWNRETFGKCNNPNWHGHNYVLEIVLKGRPDPATGYVYDLGRLKNILKNRILDQVHHKNLNLDVPFMSAIIPTTENFAVAIWNELHSSLPSGLLHCVRLFETERNWVEFFGPQAQTT